MPRSYGADTSAKNGLTPVREFSELFLCTFAKWLWLILGGLIMIKICLELQA